MKTGRLFTIAFIYCLLLVACDPYNASFISNQTNNDIIFIMKLNSTKLKGYSASKKDFLSLDDSTVSIISIDTVSLTGTYKLKSKSSLLVESSNNVSPIYKFNYLEIINGSDTTVYSSQEEIENAFKHIKGSRYELIIK